MDTDSFVINILTEDSFEDINNYIEKWFEHLIMKKMIKDHLK